MSPDFNSKEVDTVLQIVSLLRLDEQRDKLLDKIVERATKRKGQTIQEITKEIRKLCDELDKTTK